MKTLSIRLSLALTLALIMVSGIMVTLGQTPAAQARPLGVPATYVVDRTDDPSSAAAQACSAAAGDCSLRGAIINANANPGSIVRLPDDVTTITLVITPTGSNDAASGDLNVTANTTFTHPTFPACIGVKVCHTTVRGGPAWPDRILFVDDDAKVRMTNVTLRGGYQTIDGGGVFNRGNLTLVNSTVRNNDVDNDFSDGGGIYNDGHLTLINSTVMNNHITGTFNSGGGIYNDHSSVLTLTNSSVINNQALAEFSSGAGIFNDGVLLLTDSELQGNAAADSGGGIYNFTGDVTLDGSSLLSNTADGGGGILNRGSMTLTDSLVQGNTAYSHAGINNFVGELVVNNSVIQSNTATSYAGGLANSGGVMSVDNSTVQGNTAGGRGAGIYNPGGQTTLNNSVVQSNTADDAGGGIFNTGVLTLSNTTVQGNTADADGGGIYADSSGIVTLTDSMVANNTATGNGGGIANVGTLLLSNSTLRGNRATSPTQSLGGGLYNDAGGALTLDRSALLSNTARANGGGIFNQGTLTLTNSTLSGNLSGESGGGLFNGTAASRATLNHVTAANNVADNDDNGTGNGGGVRRANGVVNVANSLIAGNVDTGGEAPDCSGAITSLGYNLIQRTTGCTAGGVMTGNVSGANPLLGPIQNNGGATWSHALLAGSPAVNAANPAGCPATDQRGVARPLNVRCDIGAFESDLKAANAITFNPLASKLVSDPPFGLTATASSGLAVSFATSTPGVCSVSGNSVTLLTVGMCTLQASQAGNGLYDAAPVVEQSFQVFPSTTRTDQTITFGPLADKPVSDPPFTPGATASSGLPVSFASQTPGVCSVNGNSVALLAAGTCTLRASQAGNATYNPAPNVDQSFQVLESTLKNDQTITFNPLPNKRPGDPPFGVTATASSGLAVSFASLTPSVCTVAGNMVTLLATGACTIQASQNGNGSYNAAPPVTQSFQVANSKVYLPVVTR